MGYNEKGAGRDLENRVAVILKKHLGFNFVNVLGSYDDKCQGTDMYIYGVPVDITANFSGKDNLIYNNTTYTVKVGDSWVRFKFGIRTGNNYNGYTEFDRPVLVIGVDYHDWKLSSMIGIVAKAFEDNIINIIDIMLDQYLDYCCR